MMDEILTEARLADWDRELAQSRWLIQFQDMERRYKRVKELARRTQNTKDAIYSQRLPQEIRIMG